MTEYNYSIGNAAQLADMSSAVGRAVVGEIQVNALDCAAQSRACLMAKLCSRDGQ